MCVVCLAIFYFSVGISHIEGRNVIRTAVAIVQFFIVFF